MEKLCITCILHVIITENMHLIRKARVYVIVLVFSVAPIVVFAQQQELSFMDRVSLEVFCFFGLCEEPEETQIERDTFVISPVAQPVIPVQETQPLPDPVVVVPTQPIRQPIPVAQPVQQVAPAQTNTVVQRITEQPVINFEQTTIVQEVDLGELGDLDDLEQRFERLEDRDDRLRSLISRASGDDDGDDQGLLFDPVTNTLIIDRGNAVDLTGVNALTTLSASGTDILYTDENGLVTVIPVAGGALETVTSLTNNADGTFTYSDETGATTTLDIVELIFNASTPITIQQELQVLATSTFSGPTTLLGTTTATNLVATNATTTNLFASVLEAVTGTITNLFATTATVGDLTATSSATLATTTITDATIDTLDATTATASTLAVSYTHL